MPAAEVPQVEKCVVFADHTDDAWHEARVGTVVSSDESRQHKSSTVRLGSLEEFELELQRKPGRWAMVRADFRPSWPTAATG